MGKLLLLSLFTVIALCSCLGIFFTRMQAANFYYLKNESVKIVVHDSCSSGKKSQNILRALELATLASIKQPAIADVHIFEYVFDDTNMTGIALHWIGEKQDMVDLVELKFRNGKEISISADRCGRHSDGIFLHYFELSHLVVSGVDLKCVEEVRLISGNGVKTPYASIRGE